MTTHTICTELLDGEGDAALVEITYDYEQGYTPRTPPGEYVPIDPPVGPMLALRGATYVTGYGILLSTLELQQWAERWLNGEGRDYAIDCAETDVYAMSCIRRHRVY